MFTPKIFRPEIAHALYKKLKTESADNDGIRHLTKNILYCATERARGGGDGGGGGHGGRRYSPYSWWWSEEELEDVHEQERQREQERESENLVFFWGVNWGPARLKNSSAPPLTK